MGTLIVNLFGGPSCGKSTIAAGVFCLLKMQGIECELVLEFAKDLVWEERNKTLRNQPYIFGKQYHKIWRLIGKVDVIITDSPLLLSTVYGENTTVSFIDYVLDTVNSLNNLNIVINRLGGYNYSGRLQTKEQALLIDTLIKHRLVLDSAGCVEIQLDNYSVNTVTELVLKELNIQTLNFKISGL